MSTLFAQTYLSLYMYLKIVRLLNAERVKKVKVHLTVLFYMLDKLMGHHFLGLSDIILDILRKYD